MLMDIERLCRKKVSVFHTTRLEKIWWVPAIGWIVGEGVTRHFDRRKKIGSDMVKFFVFLHEIDDDTSQHRKTRGGVDRIYLAFDYICFSDYFINVMSGPWSPPLDLVFSAMRSTTTILTPHLIEICRSRSRSWVPIQRAKRENTNPIWTNLCVFTGAFDRW